MKAVKDALAGIIVCVCALIINSLMDLWKKAIVGLFTLFIFIISLFMYVFTDISIVAIILVMGCLSFIFESYVFPKLKNKNEIKL